MTPVVLSLDDPEEPPELLEGGIEPYMVVENDAGDAGGIRSFFEEGSEPEVRGLPMPSHRYLDGPDRIPQVREGVPFEEDESIAPSFEPVDQVVEILGRTA